jgi:cytochrome P450
MAVSMQRLSQKPHTFSDGTHIPAGVLVAASSWARHTDERAYADAHTFAPFRFEHPPNAGGGDDDTKAPGPRRQFTTTDLQYIPFGHGRHACPGRFFAGNELKAMFVHVLRTYDIRTVEPGVRPADVKMGQSMLPNPTARVLFRKRRD